MTLAVVPPVDLPPRARDAIAAVQSRWPRIGRLPDDRLAVLARLAETASVDGDRLEAVYLAAACAAGDPAAIEAFERTVFPAIDVALRRGGFDARIAEVRQLLRVRLFVGRPDAPPKIATYAGQASLPRWLRVIALREAVALETRERATPSRLDDDRWVATLADPAQNPELIHLRVTYRASFESAVERACALLRPTERNLLRLYFFERLSIDELGELYRVHRATAARRVARAQAVLAAHVRRILRRELCVGATELDSILRCVDSGLDLSLRRMFEGQEELTA